MWRVDFEQYQHDPRFNAIFNRVPVKPNWVLLTAVAAGVLVVVVPLVLLAIAGLMVGVVTYVLLGLIAKVVAAGRSLFGGGGAVGGGGPDTSGRRNVRVIHPRE